MNQKRDFGTEKSSFSDCLGSVLAEDITADRDFPPFDRVMMDGIAFRYGDLENGNRSLLIQSIQAAGEAPQSLNDKNSCIEIMTGAVLPHRADTVIRYEDLEIKEGLARINIDIELDRIKRGQNIHRKGTDRKKGDILIEKHHLISAAEMGILSTVGKTVLDVKRKAKVAIIATGDELVDPSKLPEVHQIRMSNAYSIESLLRNKVADSEIFHLLDDKSILTEKIEQLIEDFDILIFSGAVSKGKFDFLPEVLESLGVNKLFHKVRQRPGKPFWFGVSSSGKPVFALPGNPVSTFVCTLKYVIPYLDACYGLETNELFAVLADDVLFNPELTYFMQVKVENKNGVLSAIPNPGKGSGDLANLTEVNGFLELPASKSNFQKGEVYPLHAYKN